MLPNEQSSSVLMDRISELESQIAILTSVVVLLRGFLFKNDLPQDRYLIVAAVDNLVKRQDAYKVTL